MKSQPETTVFEQVIRRVMAGCADCDTCRFLMDENCLFFPALYRLHDQIEEEARHPTGKELSRLAELCTLCGLCPCPDIPMEVMLGKTERAKAIGIPHRARWLADVQRLGQCGGRVPGLLNLLLSSSIPSRLAKAAAGIHPKRRLPQLPGESFFSWARRRGLNELPQREPRVAYFAGCTAGYLFPQVARSAVSVLERCGIAVFVPTQQCCGMPTLVEGDQRTTLKRVRHNMKALLEAAQNGFDIVCSCPTCGFLMKMLLKEGAIYSEAYQRTIADDAGEIKIPDTRTTTGDGFVRLKKSMYEKILRDDGYFSSLDPLARLTLSETISDLGAYLHHHWTEKMAPGDCDGQPLGRMVYYAPCHQREQKTGTPYLELLSLIPGLKIEPVGNAMDCCGMGGSLGFKKAIYDESIRIAAPLIKKIQAAHPDAVITDCLSCRLQFEHLLSCPVFHPVEILARASIQRLGGRS